MLQKHAGSIGIAHQGGDMQRRTQLPLRAEIGSIGDELAECHRVTSQDCLRRIDRFGHHWLHQEQRADRFPAMPTWP